MADLLTKDLVVDPTRLLEAQVPDPHAVGQHHRQRGVHGVGAPPQITGVSTHAGTRGIRGALAAALADAFPNRRHNVSRCVCNPVLLPQFVGQLRTAAGHRGSQTRTHGGGYGRWVCEGALEATADAKPGQQDRKSA